MIIIIKRLITTTTMSMSMTTIIAPTGKMIMSIRDPYHSHDHAHDHDYHNHDHKHHDHAHAYGHDHEQFIIPIIIAMPNHDLAPSGCIL